MKRTKCEECGGKIIQKKVEFKLYDVIIGKYPAEVCTKCGETCFSEKTSNKIDEDVKKKGLFYAFAQRTICKSSPRVKA